MCEAIGAKPSEVLTGDVDERLLRLLVIERANRQQRETRSAQRRF